MERVISCYLPPSCSSPPLSKLSVGSWASIPFHLLKPGSQPWTSPALTSTISIQTKYYCSFSAPESQLMDWLIWENLARSSLDSARGEQQHQKGSQLPLFSMHFLYAEIVFARVQIENKKKNPCSMKLARKIVSSIDMLARKFLFFSPPFSHQYFHIVNWAYNRMLARLIQATSILKLPFFYLPDSNTETFQYHSNWLN